ncbi:7-deoxyloganetin glucosyltransferase-like protein [Tanacetum coccineum]
MTRSCYVYFPSLTGAAKRWVERLSPGTINIWDLLKKDFIQRYCPPFKMAKQLEEIHNFKSTSRRVSNDSSDGIAAITNKLDSLGRDMKKLKENVHAIQVGCENCGEAHLNKECLLNEEVKSVEEVKYGEFGRPFPNNNGNGARSRVGPSGYYTRVDNRPPFSEKKPSLEELMNNHLEESTQSRAKMEDWMKKLEESTNLNTRNQNASLKNLETQIKVSFISNDNVQVSKETEERPPGVLPCQLPPKELNPGGFTLPCTIGSLNLYAMADLRASVNIMPRSMFYHLKLKNLKETNKLVEMADMTKKAHVGIVNNVLVKIDKFLFPSDFMIIDMLGDPNETMILGRSFLATIHARIDVFDKEISLGVGDDIIECSCDDERRNEKGKEMLFLNLLLIKYGNSKIDDTSRARRSIGVRYTHGTMTDLWKKIDGRTDLYLWKKIDGICAGIGRKYYDPPQEGPLRRDAVLSCVSLAAHAGRERMDALAGSVTKRNVATAKLQDGEVSKRGCGVYTMRFVRDDGVRKVWVRGLDYEYGYHPLDRRLDSERLYSELEDMLRRFVLWIFGGGSRVGISSPIDWFSYNTS